jgi:TonB-linked SusC/RagA family outer membrane protein
VKYIGHASAEVAVGANVQVSLTTDAKALDEVVVVAYGTQSSRSLASSVSVVKAETLKDVPSASFDQILQGRASGVYVSNPSAGVGQPPVVTIRGVSTINSGMQPLYVIDGVPMTSGDIASMGNANALSDINPADIESMTILKDAAATALYGSRAANGVVLITTKKGSLGNVKINYDMNVGYSTPTKKYDVLNAEEYVTFKNQAYKNRYGQNATGPFNLMQDSNGQAIDTNWGDEIFKNGTVQNHTLSVSGANDKSDFYLSVNHTQQDGIVIGDAYDRSGIRANASVQPMKYLKVGLNANYSYGHTHYTDGSRNGSNYAVSGFPRVAIIMPPNLPVRNEDGTPYYEAGNATGYGANTVNTTFFNPVALHELGNGIDTWVNRIIASGYAEITPFTGLTLKTQYGVDHALIEDKRNWNPFHGDGFSNQGLANAYLAKETEWTWTNTASYKITLADSHNISAIIGMESSRNNYGYWNLQGDHLSDFSFSGIEADYGTYQGGGNLYEKTLTSYLGNVNYDYQYKYLLSVNFRRDGYSPLGVNSRWGNFYGAAAAWRISEESFFNPLKETVSDVKLKGSYGVVGNTDIGYYPAQSYYSGAYYGGTGSYIMTNIGDASLKWESSATINLGIEAKLWNRVTIDAEWYNKKSINLILDVAQAPSTGIYDSRLTTNAGQIQNTGVEFSIAADIIQGGDFSWNSSFNIAFNKNKVLKLEEDILHLDETDTGNTISVEGKSLAQLYLYPTGGIDPATGRRIFYGSQGEKTYFDYPNWYLEDGTLFEGDIAPVIAGNTLPTYYGGWANTFSYKGFDLNLFLQFSGGNHIFNGTKATMSDMRYWNNSKDVLNNHWTEEHKNATYARPVYNDNVSNGSAYSISDYVEKGDYLRLKNVSLGYTFNTKSWGKSAGLHISSLRLFAQAQNLFVITGYTGLDPEVTSNVLSPILTGGVDKNTLPQARAYTFGLNVSF